jgi:pyridoxal phosphate enzyme (YggS family)
MLIANNIRNVRVHIPAGVALVCVSKFQPVEAIREAYEAGERHFGESRVQELQRKVPQLPADIHWHFIGHLQTNKVRDLLKLRPYLIQSVDSIRLLQAINDEAARQGFVQDVLLEVHVAREETKTGFSPEELSAFSIQPSAFSNVRICGLMAMATNTDDETEIRRCFLTAKAVLQHSGLTSNSEAVLSMGMSDDYRLAIECGATMVRIGSTIFGSRGSIPAYSKLPKAVFFDQDGVLFNSMPYHAQSWELAMNENGLPFTANQTYRNEGRTGASVITEAYRLVHGIDAPQEVIEAVYAAKSRHFNELTGGRLPELIPGIREVLSFLKSRGVQCWVVTGSGQRSLLDSLLTTFPDTFTGIISAFDVQHGKPHPEPYLKAWERSGFAKDECMIVENAPLGIRAGKAADIFTVAVNTGPLPDQLLWDEKADIVLPNMAALLEWLQKR